MEISATTERDATSRSVGAFGRKTGQGLAQLARDLVAQIRAQLLPTPAIAQRNGDRALGVLLTDDVMVQRSDDCLGGK